MIVQNYSQIVFEQKDKLQKLNELTHPQVLIAVNNEIEKAKAEGMCLMFSLKLP